MNLDDAINAFKEAIIKVASTEIMALIIGAAPFFAWPVINQVTSFIVNQIVSLLINKTEVGIYFIRTDILTTGQASTYLKAQEDLQGAKTDDEKKVAELAVINAARDLIKFNH